MPRIAGIDVPAEKRIEVALTYVYGIGPSLSKKLLSKTKISPDKRAKDLIGEEIQELTKAITEYNIEGELRKTIRENIERLKRIGSYRGLRHQHNLPVRGQRTRTNARTKRGKRVTIGALKKEEATKLDQSKKAKEVAK